MSQLIHGIKAYPAEQRTDTEQVLASAKLPTAALDMRVAAMTAAFSKTTGTADRVLAKDEAVILVLLSWFGCD